MSLATWKDQYYPVEAAEVSEKDAIQHSLQKWTGLRPENLNCHEITALSYLRITDKNNNYFWISDTTCALCFHYDGDFDCSECPLRNALGHNCDVNNGPWVNWAENLDPEPMIAALTQCLAEAEDER